jgi:hypothetical protein
MQFFIKPELQSPLGVFTVIVTPEKYIQVAKHSNDEWLYSIDTT